MPSLPRSDHARDVDAHADSRAAGYLHDERGCDLRVDFGSAVALVPSYDDDLLLAGLHLFPDFYRRLHGLRARRLVHLSSTARSGAGDAQVRVAELSDHGSTARADDAGRSLHVVHGNFVPVAEGRSAMRYDDVAGMLAGRSAAVPVGATAAEVNWHALCTLEGWRSHEIRAS